MKPNIRLSELEQVLHHHEAGFSDRVVSSEEIRMEPEKGHLVVRGEAHPVQPHVLTHVAQKTRIPGNYLRRCPPSLRAENVNHWMEQMGSKDMLVRYDGPSVRAILSTRYRPVSNLDIVRNLRDHLPPWSDPTVVAEVTPTRMVAQVVLEEHRRLMNVGDEVFGGINLGNSEVGFASVDVTPFTHRLVCTNGMVVKASQAGYRRVHLKGTTGLSDELRVAFIHAIAGIPAALEAMRKARELPLPPRALETLPTRHGLTQNEHEAVKIAWEEEQGDSLYALLNSITGAARSNLLPLESRLKLQTLAGDLLPA